MLYELFHKNLIKFLMSAQNKYKILLVGECGVGKSSLLSRYLDGQFSDSNYKKTIGIEFFTKTFNDSASPFTYYIWDTSGAIIFRDLITKCYDYSDIIYIVFDISQKSSFLKANDWIQLTRQNLGEKVKIILVGNKCDLNREISKEEAENFASEQGIQYVETSAKDNLCVDEMFSLFLTDKNIENVNESNQNENAVKQQNINCIIE